MSWLNRCELQRRHASGARADQRRGQRQVGASAARGIVRRGRLRRRLPGAPVPAVADFAAMPRRSAMTSTTKISAQDQLPQRADAGMRLQVVAQPQPQRSANQRRRSACRRRR